MLNNKYSQVASISLFFFLFISYHVKSQNIEEYSNPGSRWGHVFIYNPNLKQIVLFGGTRERGGEYLNDTWIWNGDKWKKMNITSPAPRGFSAAVYHKKRKTIILHGGRGNNHVTYSDLWEWNGENWKQIEDSSSFKADHHQMVYINDQNLILAFGGWNGEAVMGDTWTWSNKWEKLKIDSPPKRASFSMVSIEKTDNVILYGGLWINGQYADIWKWSDNKWQSLGGPYDNSSIDHHSMIYDTKLEQVIGFGGKNYRYQYLNNTFLIEKNKVILIESEGPSERHSFGFTFDCSENLGYLFGGKAYIDEKQIALNDFWQWNGKKWRKIK